MTDIKKDCDNWPFCSGVQVIGIKLPEYLGWAAKSGTHSKELLLPTIQRGFVWKPKQIMDLWDSLLRGMPIGSFMVSKLAPGQWATNISGEKRVSIEIGVESIGLLDGQQRTLSMLLGWSKEYSTQHCLWIDLDRDGEAGAPFELRLTTKAQPFGFQRVSQTRLSRQDIKKAREEYDQRYPTNEGRRDYELFEIQNEIEQPRPYVAGGKGLFVRLIDVWMAFRKRNKDAFVDELHLLLGENIPEQVVEKIEQLYGAFERVAKLEVPLVLIPSDISQIQPKEENSKNDEYMAPLILLFERIGSNATKLTAEDLLFSMIKQQWPEAHNLVEKVRGGEFFYPMISSDYVMTAFRLAAAQAGINDNPRPRSSDFHRHLDVLLKTKADGGFGPLREFLAEDSALVKGFETLYRTLIYKGGEDNGIPNYMLPHFSRGLIQVLLRWIMLNNDNPQIIENNRETIIAFALFWYLHVWNEDKASKKSFELAGVEGDFPAREIYNALIMTYSGNEHEIGLALPLLPPNDLANILLPFESSALITASNMFKHDSVAHHTVPQRELYKRFCWWRKPVLLWLQREYVKGTFASFTLDSNLTDDDVVPYDYDHLCPQDHWGKHWSYITCRKEGFQSARHDIGNCIGNLHVLESSLNRSFGNDSLALKITKSPDEWKPTDSKLYADQNGEHEKLWVGIENTENPFDWSGKKRVNAFQQAVYWRAFNLYSEYYTVCSHILAKDVGSSEVSDK
jgi:hypothetical protein